MLTSNLQTKSRRRVTDHGEVFTNPREVNAMLDLVKAETERIDSRFLEPACGTGNFLIEILRRKLAVVGDRYARNQIEYERYAILAVSSVYGIDLLADNVAECRERLYLFFDETYSAQYGALCNEACRDAVWYILEKNIVPGNTLTALNGADPIVFSEWALVGGDKFNRREFTFDSLLKANSAAATGENAIPTPFRTYPPTNYWELQNHEWDRDRPRNQELQSRRHILSGQPFQRRSFHPAAACQ